MVRGFIRSAKAPLFPGTWQWPQLFEISDADLRAAIGDKVWVKRGPRVIRRARRLLHDLSRFFESQNVGAVLVWNGSNLIVSLAVWLARQRGIAVIFAEHGYLPGTTQLDIQGVNFNSSVTDLVASGAGLLPPDPALDKALDQEIAAYKSGKPMRVLSPKVPKRFLVDLRSWLICRAGLWLESRTTRMAPPIGFDNHELPERFVLLPFQVKKDSQLILHSPVLGNDMPGLLRLLHRTLGEIDPQMRIVVKLHPRERWDIQMAYASLVREFPDVLFVRRHRLTEILEKAAAVVTVNSTVGFEAFLYDKPVVTLGRNFYTAEGLVERVDASAQLGPALIKALTQPVNVARRRAMLRFVVDRFLAFGSYHDFSERSLRAVADRITALLGIEVGTPIAAQTRLEPPATGTIAACPNIRPSLPMPSFTA